MKWNNPYFRQVQLLVAVLPLVAKESCFALKGGTAINLSACSDSGARHLASDRSRSRSEPELNRELRLLSGDPRISKP